MKVMDSVKVFLKGNMMTIVAFLVIMCVQLMYSLMISDVDEKTYEFGMLRALGFNIKNLKMAIVIKAAVFSAPGITTGLLSAFCSNYAIRYLLFDLIKMYESYYLKWTSVAIGATVGLIIPQISSILPIRRALGKNLRESLDKQSRSTTIQISSKRIEDLGLSPMQFALGSILTFMGALVYGVAPSAFIFKNLGLFFFILNLIIILMIMGLTFIGMLIFPMIARQILSVLLFFRQPDRKLKFIINKNLKAHESRNTKTAIMFSFCLSFLIFSSSTFKLVGNMIQMQSLVSLGADITNI